MTTGHKDVCSLAKEKNASHAIHKNGPYVSMYTVQCRVTSTTHTHDYLLCQPKPNIVRKKTQWRLFQSCNTYDA